MYPVLWWYHTLSNTRVSINRIALDIDDSYAQYVSHNREICVKTVYHVSANLCWALSKREWDAFSLIKNQFFHNWWTQPASCVSVTLFFFNSLILIIISSSVQYLKRCETIQFERYLESVLFERYIAHTRVSTFRFKSSEWELLERINLTLRPLLMKWSAS